MPLWRTDYSEQQATSEEKYGLFINYAAQQPFLDEDVRSFVFKRAKLQRQVCAILESRNNSLKNTSPQSLKQDSTKRSILLDLPLELREIIYTVLLGVPGAIVVQMARRDMKENCHTRVWYRPFLASASNPPSTLFRVSESSEDPAGYPLKRLPFFDVTVLRLCRQTYSEGYRILYNNKFRVRQYVASFMLMTLATFFVFHPSSCAFVRKLEFLVWSGSSRVLQSSFPWLCKEYSHHLDAVFPNLQTLTIVVAKKYFLQPTHLSQKLEEGGERLVENVDAADEAYDVGEGAESQERLTRRILRYLECLFPHPGCEVPRWLDFRLEDDGVDAQAVAKAWKRFKG